jgi:hypothetical protein
VRQTPTKFKYEKKKEKKKKKKEKKKEKHCSNWITNLSQVIISSTGAVVVMMRVRIKVSQMAIVGCFRGKN